MANADRIIELLHEAKARPAGVEREQFLAAACGNDAALREQIVSLVQADANDGDSDFLKISQLLRPEVVPSEKPGDRIGRYKLLEQIGEGGCGVVYMAEQEEPVRRRVALKVIKLGMDTKQVIARFEAERQALAMMEHPNIAKIFDAGVTDSGARLSPAAAPSKADTRENSSEPSRASEAAAAEDSRAPILSAGRPFFVMELVRGIKITDYCDQNNLSTKARLELFIQVCQAIQHAHQKGIIHRDIKPSNILVTQNESVAVPKVIDFGIAKATTDQRLTDKTVFTAFEQFIGTPAYMSPEQAMMTSLDIDTRTDIYALGVLLYELLTGQTPFDGKELMAVGLDAMRRIIREQEPARPSTRLSTMADIELTTVARHRQAEPTRLGTLLRGDLDWIVMKALEKDRTRRYETANGLAADIQRHLSNEPVMARPPSRWYEFQKTVRRHKFGFAAAAALVIVLGLGVLASTWQALRATRAEREQIKLRREAEDDKKTAQTQAARSQQVAQFMQDMLKGVGPSAALGRDTTMLREILDKTAARIAEELKEQPEVEAELRNAIGTVYWELGEFDKAADMHRQALAMQRKRLGNEHPSVAASLNHLGKAIRFQTKLAESEAAYREALAMRRKLLGNEHPDVAQSLNDLASLLSIELKNDEPEVLLREALAIQRKLSGEENRDAAMTLDNLAHVLNRRGQVAEAIGMHQKALEIRKKVLGNTHPDLILSFKNLALALQGQGKLAEAEAMLRDAISLCDKLLGQQHPDMPQLRFDLASVLRKQGELQEAESFQREPDALSQAVATSLEAAGKYFQQQGKLTQAEAVWREALALERKLVGDENNIVANAQHKLGDVLRDSGQWAAAEEAFREAVAVRRKLFGNDHLDLGHSLHSLAWVLNHNGKRAEAEARSREALALRRKLLGNEHPDVAWTLWDLTVFLRDQGKLTEAETMIRESLAIRRKLLGNEHIEVAQTLDQLTYILRDQSKLPEAEAIARESLALNERLYGKANPQTAESLKNLAEVRGLQGHVAEAKTLFLEAAEHANAYTLNEIAFTLATSPDPELRDGPRAVTFAEKAVAGTDRKDPMIVDTLAAAYAEVGRFTNAVRVQREAIALLRNAEQQESYALRLKLYESNLPCRFPGLLSNRIFALLAEEKYVAVEPLARELLAQREVLMPDDWRTFNARSLLGGSLLGQKKYAEAEPLLLSGYTGMKQRQDKITPAVRGRIQESLQRLVQLYGAMGQSEKAADWNKQLAEFNQTEAGKRPVVPKP